MRLDLLLSPLIPAGGRAFSKSYSGQEGDSLSPPSLTPRQRAEDTDFQAELKEAKVR